MATWAIVVVASWVAVLSWRSSPASGAPSSVAANAPAPPLAHPQAVYLRDCSACHGADGRGTPRGPDLLGVGRGFVDYELTTGRMPLLGVPVRDPKHTSQLRQVPGVEFADTPDISVRRAAPAYPPDVIAGLVNYVGSLAVGGPDIPTVDLAGADLAGGGVLFRLNCAACHSWAGGGGALLNRAAPDLSHATPVQIAEAVRAGPGQMPAFGPAALSSADLNNLVAYVRYLDQPTDRGGNGLWHLGPFAEGAVALVLGLGVLLLVTGWIGERE